MALNCQIPMRVLDAEAATHPAIATLSEYWCTLAEGRIPPRAAFDFMKIYKVASHLMMAERVAPETFKFIYCGTGVADNIPRDVTGLTYGPASPSATRIGWTAFYNEILERPHIRYGREPIDWPNDEHRDLLYGACPLLGKDGRPTYIVAALVFVLRPADWE